LGDRLAPALLWGQGTKSVTTLIDVVPTEAGSGKATTGDGIDICLASDIIIVEL
jgi:hypothetical protein